MWIKCENRSYRLNRVDTLKKCIIEKMEVQIKCRKNCLRCCRISQNRYIKIVDCDLVEFEN